MAFEGQQVRESYPANADISASQFCAVKLVTGSKLAVCGAGDAGIGILQDAPAAAGRAGSVCLNGPSKAVASGTVALMDWLKSDASGYLVTTTTANDECIARAISTRAGASSGIITVIVHPIRY